MDIETVIGDYHVFFQKILNNLSKISIDITGYSISHLGYKTSTMGRYQQMRSKLLKLSDSYFENEHNGRPISKFILRNALILPANFSTTMIELMPPKSDKQYPDGLEHVGVVIGNQYPEFTKKYQPLFSGRQNQGPYCQPFFIRFHDGSRVKFYQYSLRDVVEMEKNTFIKIRDTITS